MTTARHPLAHLARRLRPLFVVLCLALPAGAQGTRFDPSRHLDGWDSAQDSEHRELYRLDEFERHRGHVLTEERLDELRQAWRVEEERVAALLQSFRRDPRHHALYLLERSLLAHPVLSRLETSTHETHDPWVFVIQRPRTSRAGYEESIFEALGAELQAVHALFLEELAEPLGLQARPGFGALPVIVLAGADVYARYVRSLEEPALYFAQAQYDASLRAVVTYYEPDDRPGEDPALRLPVLHEAVLALVDAHEQAEERRYEPWLDEGLASWLSARALHGPDAARPRDGLAVESLREATADVALRAACLLPLEGLATVHTHAQAYERMLRKAAAEGVGEPSYRHALLALYGQAGTWVWYLATAREGAFLGSLRAYLGRSLADAGGAEALRRSFEGTALAELEAGWRAAVLEHLDGWAIAEGGEDGLEATFRLSEVTASLLRREADQRVEAVELLTPDHDEPDVRFALSLDAARDGRFAQAAQDVKLLLGRVPDHPHAGRFREELARIEAFRAERARFLRHLKERGDKLNLMLGDGRLLATVEEVGEQAARLGENRLGMDELELDAIDPLELVKLMRRSRFGFEGTWIEAYPHVLCGTDDWERMLEGEGAEGAQELLALGQDGGYAEWFRLAEAAEILTRLGRAGLPERLDQARAALEDVRRLRADFGELDLLRVRQPALLRLATRAWSLVFEEEGLAEVLHAQVERTERGGMRLTYSFDDPAEAEDFEPERYLDGQRWQGSPDPEASQPFAVADGVLRARGAACSRHVLEFDGPQLVRMRYLFRVPEGPVDDRIRAVVGLCDDRDRSYVGCDMLGGITVADRATNLLHQVDADSQIFMDTEHTLEILHDGSEKVRTLFDGKPAAEAPVGPRLAGSLFLWVNSECPFEIVELVIEANVAPASLRLLRSRWIEQKLEEMGFR